MLFMIYGVLNVEMIHQHHQALTNILVKQVIWLPKDLVVTKVISKAIGDHFTLPGHKPTDMRFLPFEKVYSENDPMVLSSREEYWILKKKNLEFGINRKK